VANSYKNLLPTDYVAFPRSDLDGSIVDRFHKIELEYADCSAVKHEGVVMTYAMLDAASNSLAALLVREAGVCKQPVAMLYKHGIDAITAQFAVLKSGNFYAHIDCELGFERQQLLMENLGSRILLCDDACEAKAALLAATLPHLLVLNTQRVVVDQSASCPPLNIKPQDYAYIVFTSGSTGPPQGVIISHENVLHFTRNQTNYMHLRSADRAMQICPLWTGASGTEIFSTLLNGATLFPFSVNDGGLARLTKVLLEENISTFTAVPTLFRMLMGVQAPNTIFPAMRMIRLAGDRTTRIDVDLFQKHFPKTCLLRVGLGASEILLFAHLFIDTEYAMTGEVVPVGHPLEDVELMLLDDDLREVDQAGEYGEIAVRSRYLSVGYWKNPQLTNERFLPDISDVSKRIYLSRDIGYRDEQGLLHHVGRKDARVKIYGKMVLISDVEEALLSIAGVKEAVVVPFDSGERGTELTAWLVTEADCRDLAAIRQQLAAKIPAEIRPGTITILDALPLQSNNKINRLQLKNLAGTL
jgi:amino acid adenylation domain-containing protein